MGQRECQNGPKFPSQPEVWPATVQVFMHAQLGQPPPDAPRKYNTAVFHSTYDPSSSRLQTSVLYRSKGNGSNSHPKAGLSWPSLPIVRTRSARSLHSGPS
jgi:hypothetical protein